MTTVEMRQYLNQRINELPPSLLSVVIEFVDFLLFRKKSADADSPHVEESKVALKVALPTIQRLDSSGAEELANPLKRGSTAQNLLMFANTWVGDDAQDCLQAAQDNRSDIALELD